MDVSGSFIQLSCQRSQSETVIHKLRKGSNSFTKRPSFSYYKMNNNEEINEEIDIKQPWKHIY